MKTKTIFISMCFVLASAVAFSQNTNLKQEADSNFTKGNYKIALSMYEKLAVETHDLSALNNAAICYSHITGKSKCNYFKKMRKKGFSYRKEELFFYGCDENFNEVRIKPKYKKKK